MKRLKTIFACMLMALFSIGQVWGTDVTFDATQDSGNGSITKDGVTVSMSTMNRDQKDNFRCNANSDMTVASSNTITQIVVTCTGNGTSNYGPGKFAVPSAGVGTYTYQTSGKNGTWTGSATSITLHASAQVRITSIVVTYTAGGGSTNPTVSADPEEVENVAFAGVTDQTIALTYENITSYTTSVSVHPNADGTGTLSPAWLTASISSPYSTVTYSVDANNGDERTAYIKVHATASGNKEATTIIPVSQVENFDGLKLTFDFVNHPTGWPAAKADAAEGNYTYTISTVNYTFTHSKSGDGIYMTGTSGTSGALLMASGNTLGLPALSGYKLVKVKGTLNSAGTPSTSSSVSITDGSDVVTGGTAQTWDEKGVAKTYNLSGTAENTRYYMSVASKNCQMMTLVLYYEEAEAPTVDVPTFTPDGGNFVGSQSVTLTQADSKEIYYTTDATAGAGDPSDQTPWVAYNNNNKPSISATTTIYAAAKDGDAWSSVVSKTFTKLEPLTTMDAIYSAAETAGTTETTVAITFGGWVVTGVSTNGKNAYLTDDEYKGLVIYDGSASSQNPVCGLAEGDVLSGTAICKVKRYNYAAQLSTLNAGDLTITHNGDIPVHVVAAADVDDLDGTNVGSLIKVNGKFTTNNNKYFINGLQLYNSLFDYTAPNTTNDYNCTGVFVIYKPNSGDDVPEICPRKTADIEMITEKVLSSISIDGTYPIVFEQDDAFSHEGMTVTAHYTDNSTEDVTDSQAVTFTGYNMANTGEQTVTVHYSENTTEVTTTYTITVSAPAPTGDWELFEGALTDLVAGDYLIYHNGYESSLMKAEMISGKGRLAYEVLAPDANGIISEPSRYAVWTLAKSGDYWTLYNAKAGKYAAATGASGKAQLLASDEEGKILWSIDEDLNISSKYNAEQEPAVNALLRHNFTTTGQNAGNYGFACYGSSTGAKPVFYKQAVASYYITETLTGCSAADGNATKVPQALTEDVVLKYNLTAGYVWPDEITVTVGGVALDASELDYLWDTDKAPAELTIAEEKVTGNIAVTITAVEKELSSISIAQAPNKVAYETGEVFNPAGLRIQLNYTAGASDVVEYSNLTAGDFTFSPNLETALAPENTVVEITYGGKSVNQAITVTDPVLEAKTVVFIAEFDSKLYAMSNVVDGNQCEAIEVTKNGDNLVVASAEEKAAVQWYMSKLGSTVNLQEADENGKYLSGNSDNASFAESDDKVDLTMTQADGKYIISAGGTRAIMYRNTGVFKHYSTGSSANEYAKVSEIFEVAEGATNIVVVTPVVHEFSINPDEAVAFGKVEQGDEIEAKSFEVTLTNIENATVTLGGTGAAAFSIGEVSSLDENGGTITVTPNTEIIGNYSATITLHDVAEEAEDKVINVTMNVVAPRDCDRTDDFNTVNSGTPSSYDVERNTTDGWHAVNTAVTTKDDVTYLMINGKTSASGVITSPEFNYGIKELSLSYYYPYNETKGVSFKVEIIQDAVAVKTYSITKAKEEVEKGTVYTEIIENINVEGKFQIVITNLCPTNSTSNADRYAIGDLCWKKYGDPTIETVRPSLNEGKWGTICPKQNVINPTGASFFTLSYGEFNGEMLDKVFFDEIGANESLVAGKPYLFIANGDEIRGIKDGAEVSVTKDYNGFHGVLEDNDLNVDVENKYYIVYNNEIRLCGIGEFTILAERAYLEVSDIPGSSTTQPAPGRRRLVMNVNNGNQMPTGIEGIEVSEAPRKVIINGELYIIRGEKCYDVRGQLVK